MLFRKAEWERYFGDVATEPPLPLNIEHILNSSCPFWTGKKVSDTHLLVLIPKTIEGRPFNLNTLEELIQNPREGKKSSYSAYDNYVKKELGNITFSSHWVLITRNVIPDSQNKRYSDQKKLLESYAQKSEESYLLPTALEAATCILVEYVRSGTMLYSDNPWTYTRCLETVNNNQWPVSIGGFSSEGLYIHDCRYAYSHYYIGVAGVRSFLPN